MELALDLNKRYTYADYLTWMDDRRRELIDGFIRMMSPAANLRHQSILLDIASEIRFYVKRKNGNCKVFVAPFDVRLPKTGETQNDMIHTVVQPDICVVCDPSKLDKRGCVGAPDMIVEIQSPSTSTYDARTKFDLYERAGVREYWMAHQEEGIDVFILQPDGKYGERRYYQAHESVPVHVLPGCEINLTDIYQ